jgi:hypothetical protein
MMHGLAEFIFFNLAVYEVEWKNIAKPDRPQMKTRGMQFGCWISKATNTNSDCVYLFLFHCNNG